MVHSCCVVGCTNRKRGDNKRLHFYRMPKRKSPVEKRRRQAWIRAIGREDWKTWSDEKISNAKICGAHFISGQRSDDPEHPDWIPSVFKRTAARKKSIAERKVKGQARCRAIRQEVPLGEASADPENPDCGPAAFKQTGLNKGWGTESDSDRETDSVPYSCVAYGCGKTQQNGVTLYRFPKDPVEFRKWEKQVQRTRSQWSASPDSHLCSEHFGREYFDVKFPLTTLKTLAATGKLKLNPGAVPTVFIRPPCSAGCGECELNAQQLGIATEARGHCVPAAHDERAHTPFYDADGEGEEPRGYEERETARRSRKEVAEDRPVKCEMCGTAGASGSFFSKTKRFCSTSCSRSYSSNSKKSSILARLQVRGAWPGKLSRKWKKGLTIENKTALKKN
ncbi:lethal(3)malignant brain tumor-like protein 2 [Lampris incognitus]|uniref:lethal(3)malignant brain tumor-like protein 2 n=1 Tax=Lampris incognitus TaxID=2546036 RepID=UPI0024B4D22A|nr:lethal(3)malignant brain tumor-like protein 2 [Lampris incognitus]